MCKDESNKEYFYRYHPKTHEYLGTLSDDAIQVLYEAIKFQDKQEIFKRFNVTDKKVPETEFRKNAVFNVEKDMWEILDDFREYEYNANGKERTGFAGYYLPQEGDTPNSPPRFNKTFGPLPEGAVDKTLEERGTLVIKIISLVTKEVLDRIAGIYSLPGTSDYTIYHPVRGYNSVIQIAEFNQVLATLMLSISMLCLDEDAEEIKKTKEIGKKYVNLIRKLSNPDIAYSEVYEIYNQARKGGVLKCLD